MIRPMLWITSAKLNHIYIKHAELQLALTYFHDYVLHGYVPHDYVLHDYVLNDYDLRDCALSDHGLNVCALCNCALSDHDLLSSSQFLIYVDLLRLLLSYEYFQHSLQQDLFYDYGYNDHLYDRDHDHAYANSSFINSFQQTIFF